MLSTVRMGIEPDAAQRKFIDETLDVHCYVYNGMLTAVNLFFGMNGRLPSETDLNRVGTRIWQNTPCFHGIYQNTMNCISKRVLHAYKCCNENIRRVNRTVDEQGHEWIYFGYVHGMRNFWICADDPTNENYAVRDVDEPELYRATEPTEDEVKLVAKEEIGNGMMVTRRGIFIVIACICTFSMIFLAAYYITCKLKSNNIEE